MGIPIYSNEHTINFLGGENYVKNIIESKQEYSVGEFTVFPFDVYHDVPCLGFLIHHPECGNVVFITDTRKANFKFNEIDHLIIEANYCEEILAEYMEDGKEESYVNSRVRRSHLSLQKAKEMIKHNTINHNIVLIHLSNGNSHETRFKREVQGLSGVNTVVADVGIEVDFSLNKWL